MSQEFDLGRQVIQPVAFVALLTKARKRGYKPGGPILREYVDSEPRKGRPPKLTPDRTARIVAVLTSDKACRKFSTQKLADKINRENPDDPPLSRRTVLRALTAQGFKPVKHTTKPGLKKQGL
ncbi:hypothetical protein F4802DRAFT_565516 [Xylaria palmicola]|nr:hypothetical protein F4802DRAFT_565516 [Xylaria palmicola]